MNRFEVIIYATMYICGFQKQEGAGRSREGRYSLSFSLFSAFLLNTAHFLSVLRGLSPNAGADCDVCTASEDDESSADLSLLDLRECSFFFVLGESFGLSFPSFLDFFLSLLFGLFTSI
jgi:hypothetical protein